MEQKTLYDIYKYVNEHRVPFSLNIDWLTPTVEIRIQDDSCGTYVVRYPSKYSAMLLENTTLLYEAVVKLSELRSEEVGKYYKLDIEERTE